MKSIAYLLLFLAMGFSTADGEGASRLLASLFQHWIWLSLAITACFMWVTFRDREESR